jgi:hypothetical protein
MDLKKTGCEIWTGFILLRIESSGGIFCTRQRTLGSLRGAKCYDKLVTSQEGLCCLVI